MRNGLDIQIRKNLIASLESPYKDIRQTTQGIKWALEFLNSLTCEILSEKEFKHAMRLTYFRGNTCPAFHG